MLRDYDEYRGLHSGSNEVSKEAGSDGVSLDELLEKDFL